MNTLIQLLLLSAPLYPIAHSQQSTQHINITEMGSGKAGFQGELTLCDFSNLVTVPKEDRKKFQNKKIITYGNGALFMMERSKRIIINTSGNNGQDAQEVGRQGHTGGDAGNLFVLANTPELLKEVLIVNLAGQGGRGGPPKAGVTTTHSNSVAGSAVRRGLFRRSAVAIAASSFYSHTTTPIPAGDQGADGREGTVVVEVSDSSCERIYKEYEASLSLMRSTE